MTNYIAGIETRDNGKTVLIKRKSNCRWYSLIDILLKVKEGFDQAELPKLKGQFFTEYKEILKICFVFGIPVPFHLKLKEKKKEEL